jgi:hypothetical protein
MSLQDREATIREIIVECNHEQKEGGEDKIFVKWRANLEKAPTLLKPFQIDQIVREARRRLESGTQ